VGILSRFIAKNGLFNNGKTLTGVDTPVNGTDAANKDYADSLVAGVRSYLFGTLPTMTGTTIIPWDNTVPTITEGTLLVTAVITPKSVSSKMKIEFSSVVGADGAPKMVTVTVFRNSTLITAVGRAINNATRPADLSFVFVDQPATTSPITYTIRIGVDSSSWYLNSDVAGKNYGGMMKTSWIIDELL